MTDDTDGPGRGPTPSGAFLSARGLTKRFPGVLALDGVDVDVRPGEVHALIGENGAGKSTLVRLLAGVERPDSGVLELDGRPYAPTRTGEALAAGVRVVYQELTLLPYLSVAENLFLHRLPRRFGIVDRRALRDGARRLLARVGLDVNPSIPVARLGIAQMQLVEIAKALSDRCRLLIMDEPTASLTPPETATLHRIIGQLVADGVAVLYISHHLEDVFEVSDRVTVLRNGHRVITTATSDLTVPDAVRHMVGRQLAEPLPEHRIRHDGPPLLEVRDVLVQGAPAPVSLAVGAGEILGIAGLVGAGRTELVRAIFGADPAAGGTVLVEGRAVRIRSPRDAIRQGISLLTEDRKAQGLLLPSRVDVNVTLASLRAVTRRGLLRRRTERALAQEFVGRLRVKAPNLGTEVRTLSGGNQQKIVLAKWLARDSRILIVDEPTRGIDVGARQEIHNLLAELARQGTAVVVVSSDLPELRAVSDRIVVLSRGRITGELRREEFDDERILTLAYAGYRDAADPSTAVPTESRTEAPA